MVVKTETHHVASISIEGEEHQVAVHLRGISQSVGASAFVTTEGSYLQSRSLLFHTIDLDDARNIHVVGVLVDVHIPMVFFIN